MKPNAIMIAEGDEGPIYYEKAFDLAYDFRFLELTSSLWSNSMGAAKAAWWLKGESDSYQAGALRVRYLEGHDLNYTVVSKFGIAGSKAFAAFLFSIDGIPMIYTGQEVGNSIAQQAESESSIEWTNPHAVEFRSFYSKLIRIRLNYPVMRQGTIVPLTDSDGTVLAFARVMIGADPILTIINFSDSRLNCTLDMSAQLLGLQTWSMTYFLLDLLENQEYEISASALSTLKVSLDRYQARIYVVTTTSLRSDAKDLLAKARDLKLQASASNFTSSEAQGMIQTASDVLHSGEITFELGAFAAARDYAQTSMTLFQNAFSIERSYRETQEALQAKARYEQSQREAQQKEMLKYLIIGAVFATVVSVAAYILQKRTRKPSIKKFSATFRT